MSSPFLRSRLVSALLALAGLALVAAPAGAHSGLVSSDPTDGTTVRLAPAGVSVTFNEAIRPDLAALALTRGRDRPVALEVRQGNSPYTLVADVPPDATRATAWTVRYRVASVDGHPVSGTISFDVTDPSRTTTTPAVGDSSVDATGSSTSGDGSSGVLVLAAGAGVLLLGLVGGRLVRARRELREERDPTG